MYVTNEENKDLRDYKIVQVHISWKVFFSYWFYISALSPSAFP